MTDRQTQVSPKPPVANSPAEATEPSRGATVLPRVSARLEQVGEEFNRWRASFGSDASPTR